MCECMAARAKWFLKNLVFAVKARASAPRHDARHQTLSETPKQQAIGSIPVRGVWHQRKCAGLCMISLVLFRLYRMMLDFSRLRVL